MFSVASCLPADLFQAGSADRLFLLWRQGSRMDSCADSSFHCHTVFSHLLLLCLSVFPDSSFHCHTVFSHLLLLCLSVSPDSSFHCHTVFSHLLLLCLSVSPRFIVQLSHCGITSIIIMPVYLSEIHLTAISLCSLIYHYYACLSLRGFIERPPLHRSNKDLKGAVLSPLIGWRNRRWFLCS